MQTREIAELPCNISGFEELCITTNGFNMSIEYQYWELHQTFVGRMLFSGVRNFYVRKQRTDWEVAPDKADTVFEFQDDDRKGFVIWFYEDVIVEIEADEFTIEEPLRASLPDEFAEWRLARTRS